MNQLPFLNRTNDRITSVTEKCGEEAGKEFADRTCVILRQSAAEAISFRQKLLNLWADKDTDLARKKFSEYEFMIDQKLREDRSFRVYDC